MLSSTLSRVLLGCDLLADGVRSEMEDSSMICAQVREEIIESQARVVNVRIVLCFILKTRIMATGVGEASSVGC
jgi:hypothetical protein